VQEAIVDHAERLELGENDVLCRTPRRTLLRRDYYNREIWKPAVKAAGLMPDTTFHDLRHTFASTALAEGVPISEVSRWLGHKSITTTVDLYGHLVPEASARARTALDGAFAAARARAADAPPAGACATDVQGRPPATTRRRSGGGKGVSRPVGRVLCPGVPDLGGCAGHAAWPADEVSAVLSVSERFSRSCAPVVPPEGADLTLKRQRSSSSTVNHHAPCRVSWQVPRRWDVA
jgi:hypothetical protein